MRFPLKVFTVESAIVGYDDRYRSSVVGQKFSGWPKGVYVGFTPSVSPPSPVISFAINPTEGFSLVKLPSSADPAGVDVILTSVVQVDLSSVVTFPVFVTMRAAYYDDAPPTAEIVVYPVGSGVPWNEVILCLASGSPPALVISADPGAGTRTEPLATGSAPFGYMPAGSMEDLATAVDMVNEVVAARLGFDGTPYTTLSERIAGDYSAASMAGRLGRVLNTLRSNDYAVPSGSTQFNVSGSFSQVNRDFNPRVTLGGEGAEDADGAVAAPNDSVRNVAIVLDTNTGYRLIDDDDDRNILFGRVDGPTVEQLSGTLSFVFASVDVNGTDTSFTDELQVGDTIKGQDGLYYEVLTILDDTHLILRDAYLGTNSSASSELRRWMLRLRKLVGGVESSAQLQAAATLRFFFPAFFTRATASFDYDLAHMTPGTAPPLPSASTTVPGRVLLGASTSLAGALLLQNGGVPLAGGPFHTLNFPNGSGQIVQTTPGKVTIGEIGAQGPQGPAGTSGAQGPAGPIGPGFTARTTFLKTSIATNPAFPAPSSPFSFTLPMGHTVRHMSAGIAMFRDLGSVFTPTDYIDITLISFAGSNATITGDIYGDNEAFLFFSSAGD